MNSVTCPAVLVGAPKDMLTFDLTARNEAFSRPMRLEHAGACCPAISRSNSISASARANLLVVAVNPLESSAPTTNRPSASHPAAG